MIKALIVDDNLEYVKLILNRVLNKFQELHIEYVATTAQEAVEVIRKKQIDIIFLDLRLPDKEGFYIIDEIKLLNLINFPYIIVISEDDRLIEKAKTKYSIFDVIRKLEREDLIFLKIKNDLFEINYTKQEKQIKEFIISELSNIGYNWKYKGTLYLFEAILYIYQHNNMDLLDNVEKNVYKYISYKSGKGIVNIKTNIIKATNSIKSKENLTPKLVISNIITKLVSGI